MQYNRDSTNRQVCMVYGLILKPRLQNGIVIFIKTQYIIYPTNTNVVQLI